MCSSGFSEKTSFSQYQSSRPSSYSIWSAMISFVLNSKIQHLPFNLLFYHLCQITWPVVMLLRKSDLSLWWFQLLSVLLCYTFYIQSLLARTLFLRVDEIKSAFYLQIVSFLFWLKSLAGSCSSVKPTISLWFHKHWHQARFSI